MAGTMAELAARRAKVVAAYFDESVPLSERTSTALGARFGLYYQTILHDVRASGYETRDFRPRRLPTSVTISCDGCGESFTIPQWKIDHGQRFCSVKCRRSPLTERECKFCGATMFVPEYITRQGEGKGTYCSKECGAAGTALGRIGKPNPAARKSILEYHRQKRETGYPPSPLKGEWLKFNCEICGVEYERPVSATRRGRKPKHCSRECSHEAKRRVTGTDHPLYSSEEKPCEWCGEPFLIKQCRVRDGAAKYCSKQCQGAASCAAQGGRSSSIEDAMALAFDAIGVKYERQARIGRWSVDFLLVDAPIVVECDGDYWHARAEVIARDERKNADLLQRGYGVVRLPEWQIKSEANALARSVAEYQEAATAAAGVYESWQVPVPIVA